MFTVEQIQTAHLKVKSGADFPSYIKEIKALGVVAYDAYVSDGHIDYRGANGYLVQEPAKYEPLVISESVDYKIFKTELKAHQQGKTDYSTFIRMCSDTGIEKWKISMDEMTCSYYDRTGNEILVEDIPLAEEL
jgi:Phage envelope protein